MKASLTMLVPVCNAIWTSNILKKVTSPEILKGLVTDEILWREPSAPGNTSWPGLKNLTAYSKGYPKSACIQAGNVPQRAILEETRIPTKVGQERGFVNVLCS